MIVRNSGLKFASRRPGSIVKHEMVIDMLHSLSGNLR